MNAIPLAGVRFDATDRGPGDLLSDFVDAFVGAATFVVQGLVLIGEAIAAFFAQAAAFLVELGMAIIGAIQSFLGQVAEAVEKVGGALAEFGRWAQEAIRGFFSALFDALFKPIIQILAGFAQSVVEGFDAALTDFEADGELPSGAGRSSVGFLFGPSLTAVMAVSLVAAALLIAFQTSLPVIGLILAFVAPLIALVIIQAILGSSGPQPMMPDAGTFDLTIAGTLALLTIVLNAAGISFVSPSASTPTIPTIAAADDSFLVELLALLFDDAAIVIDAYLAVSKSDSVGLVAVGFAIGLMVITLVMQIHIQNTAPGQIREILKDILELGLLATSIMAFLATAVIAFRKPDPVPWFRTVKFIGLGVSAVGVALSVAALAT